MGIKDKFLSLFPTTFRDKIHQIIDKRSIDKISGLAIDFFDGFEVAYRKNTADEEVIKYSFSNDIFFSSILEYKPEEDHVIIDVGAHIGPLSLLCSSKVTKGKVYAIEASKDTFNLLKINVALNHLANISIHHLALADKNGTCTLYHDLGNWGHSIVKKLSKSSEVVEACTLSAFLEKERIAVCHFMKLNCEGGEFPILLSTSKNVLQRFGTILVAYHTVLWNQNTYEDLIVHLEACGFNCVTKNQTPKGGWIIATNKNSLHYSN